MSKHTFDHSKESYNEAVGFVFQDVIDKVHRMVKEIQLEKGSLTNPEIPVTDSEFTEGLAPRLKELSDIELAALVTILVLRPMEMPDLSLEDVKAMRADFARQEEEGQEIQCDCLQCKIERGEVDINGDELKFKNVIKMTPKGDC